jgi:hypothetical protein
MEGEAPAWVWQGFFGPMQAAAYAKATVDADSRAGAWVPPIGAPPVAVDTAGAVGMFAVQVRPAARIACPPGLEEARPELVGRLVGG